MKRVFVMLLAAALLTAFLGCACAKPEETPNASAAQGDGAAESLSAGAQVNEPIAPPEDIQLETPEPVPTATPGKDEPITYNDSDVIVIKYYDVVADEDVTKEYEVSGDENNQTAFDAVNDLYLKDVLGGEGLEINSVTYTDGNVFVDFTPSVYELGVGSTGELALLDSIADAYLNNVDGIKGVYYLVDGQPYSSDHIEIPANEPYKYNK